MKAPVEYEQLTHDKNTELFDGISKEMRQIIGYNNTLPDIEKERENKLKTYTTEQTRANTVKSFGSVRPLKSDYLGMESYFYNEADNKIYSVDNTTGKEHTVSLDVSRHLRQLNNIRAPPSETPVVPWDGVDKSKLTNLNMGSEYEKARNNYSQRAFNSKPINVNLDKILNISDSNKSMEKWANFNRGNNAGGTYINNDAFIEGKTLK